MAISVYILHESMSPMNIQHSSRSNEWYTPADIIDRVRKVLGDITLDPASCAAANEIVRASRYLTKDEDGLRHDWSGASIYLNPPGGKTGNMSNVGLWWRKLMASRSDIEHAIFMCFSCEALQTTQRYCENSVSDFPFCVPRARIRFVPASRSLKASPSHSNLIVYVHGTVDRTRVFAEAFESLGKICL